MNPHQETYIVRYIEGPWDQSGLERKLNDLAAAGYELVTAVPLEGEIIPRILRPKGRPGGGETEIGHIQ